MKTLLGFAEALAVGLIVAVLLLAVEFALGHRRARDLRARLTREFEALFSKIGAHRSA